MSDPDSRPDIYGKIGNSGVSIATLDDLKVLCSGFDLCDPATSVSMTINGPAPMILAMYLNAAVDQQVEEFRAQNGRAASVFRLRAPIAVVPYGLFAQGLAVQDKGRRRRHGDNAARIPRALAILGMLALIAVSDSSAAVALPPGAAVTGVQAATPVPGTAAQAPPPEATARCSDARDLHAGVLLGCVARLRKLLEVKPEQRELRNPQGQTPLSVAVLRGRSDAAEVLLAGGADVNAPIRSAKGMRPNYSGLQLAQRPELAEDSTPLIMARDVAMVALLLRFGADTRPKNSYGWSAIFYFTHHGTPDMLDALLGAGAAIDDTADFDPSHAGSTPLMWAAYMNRGAHLRTLLKYNPRLDIRDRAKKTALDYARQFGHVEAIQLLSAASAGR